jgi:hypothetical protein
VAADDEEVAFGAANCLGAAFGAANCLAATPTTTVGMDDGAAVDGNDGGDDDGKAGGVDAIYTLTVLVLFQSLAFSRKNKEINENDDDDMMI